MQFRAGAIYIVLFLVVAAGAYGVIATAESPTVTIDEADADHQLEVGDDFTVNDRTYNVSELTGDTGTLEHVNESAILEVEWSDGDTVQLEEDGDEYTVMINDPEEAEDEADEDDNGDEADDEEAEGDDADEAEDENGDDADENGDEADDEDAGGDEAEDENGDEADEAEDDAEVPEEDEEAQPETFTLLEDYDEDEYQIEEFEDGQYVIVEDDDGTLTAIPIEEFDEIEGQTYEVGDSIEFYDDETEAVVEGQVVDLSADTVTIEYEGEEVTEHELENGQTVAIDGEEFGVYFPSEDVVYLTEDIESFEQQHAEIEEYNDQIHGLWWVVVLSLVTVSLIAGLAFMPVRG
ncbi:hypothetical protein [Natrononativus amylolyticus]|uniref:hypothetical protein n=1 Tax=Natrononativus amylolyticus TaxID=2963434 RepID=UPI0020CF9468|nr:hypothetical protein [Natrononativus amylolyticus]